MVKSKNPEFFSNSSDREAGIDLITPKVRLAFTQLRQAFVDAPILHHLNLECYIWIEIDVSSYAISGILNKLVFKTRPDEIVNKIDLGQ